MRGKNSAMKRFLRKKSKNIIDERRLRREAARKRDKDENSSSIEGSKSRRIIL
jgi:U3 small nucleolar RNA-associated protein 7